MLAQQLVDASWILEREIELDLLRQGGRGRSAAAGWMRRAAQGIPLCCILSSGNPAPRIIPGSSGVCFLLGVESREQSVHVGQLEIIPHDERCVGVIDEVFLCDSVVFNRVTDNASEKGDIRPSANLAKQIGRGGGAGEARVHYDRFRVPLAFRLDRPLVAARVIFGGIPTHDQHHVGILDVDPPIGHCTASERWCQT